MEYVLVSGAIAVN